VCARTHRLSHTSPLSHISVCTALLCAPSAFLSVPLLYSYSSVSASAMSYSPKSSMLFLSIVLLSLFLLCILPTILQINSMFKYRNWIQIEEISIIFSGSDVVLDVRRQAPKINSLFESDKVKVSLNAPIQKCTCPGIYFIIKYNIYFHFYVNLEFLVVDR
jgi:hypothetical protein